MRLTAISRGLLGAASMIACASHSAAKAEESAPVEAVEVVSGLLVCKLSNGVPCGEDRFTLTLQTDGERTLQATQTDPGVGERRSSRNMVILHVDPDFRPLHAFMQFHYDDKFNGAGTFIIDEKGDILSTIRTPERILSETIDAPENFALSLHPVSSNGWRLWHYDHEKGGKQVNTRCSATWAKESIRCALIDADLEYLGEETVAVPAGEFASRRYSLGEGVEIWLIGPHMLPAKFVWTRESNPGMIYELVELRTEIRN